MAEYYPGSKQPVKRYGIDALIPPADEEFELNYPDFKGTGYYTIGALCLALNRLPVTIRKWEKDGVIPKPTYIRSSADPRGKRRLYTKDQIMGMRKIAEDEGLLEPNANGHWKPLTGTEFRTKVLALFFELEKN